MHILTFLYFFSSVCLILIIFNRKKKVYYQLYSVRNKKVPTQCHFGKSQAGKQNIFVTHSVAEWKEIFYLTTHSTHFIYGYMASVAECDE